MKKIFWFIFSVLFFFCIDTAFSVEGKIHLMGYPRSGNHWVRFCLENLLSSADALNQEPRRYTYWGHNPSRLQLDRADQEKDYLIVIVRNYRECMMRHHNNRDDRMLDFLNFEDSYFKQLGQAEQLFESRKSGYILTLKCYEKWNPATRFLVYYEDLINDPETTLKSLMRFLGQDEALVDDFMADFEAKRDESYDRYRNPQSRYSNLLYHTSLMAEEVILGCDEFMRTKYPDYWEKYLSRFAYQPE